MATAHTLSGLSLTAPLDQETIVPLAYNHGFITKPYPGGGGTVTDFTTGATNWSNLIQGAMPLERTRDGTEITFLDGSKGTSDAPLTFPPQTVLVRAYLGSVAHDILRDYDYSTPTAANSGKWMAAARPLPDGNALVGSTRIQNYSPVGDPEADLFGYNVTWEFKDMSFWDARTGVVAPAYTASGSSTTGAAGAAQTVNGTNLLNVERVQFRTTAGVLVATVQRTAFATRTNAQIIFTPSGLAGGTTYNRVLVHAAGEVAAGQYATS